MVWASFLIVFLPLRRLQTDLFQGAHAFEVSSVIVAAVFAREALVASPGLDKCAVHTEVLA